MISELRTYAITCDDCGRREIFHGYSASPPAGWEQIADYKEIPAYGNSFERVPIWRHRCPKCMKKELDQPCPTPKKASTDQAS